MNPQKIVFIGIFIISNTHTGIVRYLAGRFPETTTALDDNGRTPLHYAATLKDNGHFYNMLTHLGANPKAEDNVSESEPSSTDVPFRSFY